MTSKLLDFLSLFEGAAYPTPCPRFQSKFLKPTSEILLLIIESLFLKYTGRKKIKYIPIHLLGDFYDT
jgi:hypothetical protein